MERMRAVSKSAFGASVFAIVLLLFFASVAGFSKIGLVREIMLWLAVAVTPIAMVTGIISGYAKEQAGILKRIEESRSGLDLLSAASKLPDDELEEVTNNRRLILFTLDGQQHQMEWRRNTAQEIRQAIEIEREQVVEQLAKDILIPRSKMVAWWEKYILPQWAC